MLDCHLPLFTYLVPPLQACRPPELVMPMMVCQLLPGQAMAAIKQP